MHNLTNVISVTLFNVFLCIFFFTFHIIERGVYEVICSQKLFKDICNPGEEQQEIDMYSNNGSNQTVLFNILHIVIYIHLFVVI